MYVIILHYLLKYVYLVNPLSGKSEQKINYIKDIVIIIMVLN